MENKRPRALELKRAGRIRKRGSSQEVSAMARGAETTYIDIRAAPLTTSTDGGILKGL